MPLTLSPTELALLANALTVTSSPLAYARPSEWRTAVRLAIEPLLGADKSASGLALDGEPFLESPAEDTRAWEVYVESHFADETGDRRIGRRGPEVAHAGMVHDLPGLRRSEVYNEFVVPYQMFHPVSIQLVVAGSGAPALISFFHTTDGKKPFDERSVAILELIRPVFRASVELLSGFSRTWRGAAFSELVDALPDAAALCNSAGQVVHESPSLARMLASEPLASRVRGAIAAAGRALAGPREGGGTKSATIPLGTPASFEVRGVRQRYAVRGSLLTNAPALARGATVIVLVSSAPPRACSDLELGDRFALTAREIQVARLLAVGRSARDVARTLGISYHTARHHVEHVLAKLGVQTRAAVAAAMTAVCD